MYRTTSPKQFVVQVAGSIVLWVAKNELGIPNTPMPISGRGKICPNLHKLPRSLGNLWSMILFCANVRHKNNHFGSYRELYQVVLQSLEIISWQPTYYENHYLAKIDIPWACSSPCKLARYCSMRASSLSNRIINCSIVRCSRKVTPSCSKTSN